MRIDPAVWIALGTFLAAIAAGYFGTKGAGKTAQPSAQDAINAGFTALTARQVEELMSLRTDVNSMRTENREQARRIDHLEEQVEQQVDKEKQFRKLVRALLQHVDELRKILSDANLGAPQDPFNRADVEALLRQRD